MSFEWIGRSSVPQIWYITIFIIIHLHNHWLNCCLFVLHKFWLSLSYFFFILLLFCSCSFCFDYFKSSGPVFRWCFRAKEFGLPSECGSTDWRTSLLRFAAIGNSPTRKAEAKIHRKCYRLLPFSRMHDVLKVKMTLFAYRTTRIEAGRTFQ